MEKLIVFYSDNGNTRYAARTLAEKIGADLLELKPNSPMPKPRFENMFWGNNCSVVKCCTLQKYDKDISKYDQIYIGTPSWSGCICPAIKAFLKQEDLQNKEVAFFCCHNGNDFNLKNEIHQLLPKTKIVGNIDFEKPKYNKQTFNTKLENWINNKVKTA